jgi:hypothetical protein
MSDNKLYINLNLILLAGENISYNYQYQGDRCSSLGDGWSSLGNGCSSVS